jgi:hypothetical protein
MTTNRDQIYLRAPSSSIFMPLASVGSGNNKKTGMQLPEKYKENLDVLSKALLSGS